MAVWSLIYGFDGVTIVVVFSLLLIEIQSKTFDFKRIGNFVIRKFDEYSFSIYLAHTTCLEFFATLRDMYGINTLIVAVLSFISSILLTIVLHNLVEKPFERLKKRIA